MPSKQLILCRPLLPVTSIFPSIRTSSKESVLHIKWAKYWSFSFNISPCNYNSGLISFRMDWLDLLAVQGTLESLLQYRSSKTLILPLFPFCHGNHLFAMILVFQVLNFKPAFSLSSFSFIKRLSRTRIDAS